MSSPRLSIVNERHDTLQKATSWLTNSKTYFSADRQLTSKAKTFSYFKTAVEKLLSLLEIAKAQKSGPGGEDNMAAWLKWGWQSAEKLILSFRLIKLGEKNRCNGSAIPIYVRAGSYEAWRKTARPCKIFPFPISVGVRSSKRWKLKTLLAGLRGKRCF